MKYDYLLLAAFPLGNPFEPNTPGKRLHTTAPDAIQAFATSMQANNVLMGQALTNLATGVLAQDALITQLQNSPGQISPADQATLDQLQAGSVALVAQANAISTAPPGTVPPVIPLPSVP